PPGATSPSFTEPSPRKPHMGLAKRLVIGTVLALMVSAIGLYALLHFWHKDHPPPVTGRDMVFIKGGMFRMGSDVGRPERKPAHNVTGSSFYMDKTEVTNAEYAKFVKATGHPSPINDDSDPQTKGYWTPWNGNDPPQGRER